MLSISALQPKLARSTMHGVRQCLKVALWTCTHGNASLDTKRKLEQRLSIHAGHRDDRPVLLPAIQDVRPPRFNNDVAPAVAEGRDGTSPRSSRHCGGPRRCRGALLY